MILYLFPYISLHNSSQYTSVSIVLDCTIAWLCCVWIKNNLGIFFFSPLGKGKVDIQRVGGGLQAVFKLLVKDIWAQNRYGCFSTPNQPSRLPPIFHAHKHTRMHKVPCEDWGRWLPMAAASWQHAIRNSRPVDQSCRHDSFAARPGSLSADATAAPSPVSPH